MVSCGVLDGGFLGVWILQFFENYFWAGGGEDKATARQFVCRFALGHTPVFRGASGRFAFGFRGPTEAGP
jgi:hypothetical protein